MSSDQKVPKSFNVQGTIYEANGEPFIGVAAIKFQILDPQGTCVLYEETIPGIDTTTVHGSFSVNLGVTGNRINNIDSSNILGTNIFENNRNVNVAGCGPVAFPMGARRRLRINYDSTGTGQYLTMSPDLDILTSPYSMISEYSDNSGSLGGLPASDYIHTNVSSVPGWH